MECGHAWPGAGDTADVASGVQLPLCPPPRGLLSLPWAPSCSPWPRREPPDGVWGPLPTSGQAQQWAQALMSAPNTLVTGGPRLGGSKGEKESLLFV